MKKFLGVLHFICLCLVIYVYYFRPDAEPNDKFWGIGIIGMFGFLAYLLYNDQLNSVPRFQNILLSVSLICLFFPFMIYPIPILSGAFLSIPIIYSISPVYTYIEIGLFAITLISGLLFYGRRSSSFNPVYRLIFISSFRLLPIVLVISRIIFACIAITLDINVYEVFTLVAGIVVLMCLAAYVSTDPVHFFIPAKKYALYLRSFGDDNVKISKAITSILPYSLWQVANPTGAPSRNTHISSFFLTSRNWKKHLDYYIERAESVFLMIGKSNGLVWEIFEHDRHMHKFVYYLRKTTKAETIEFLKEETDQKHPIVQFLNSLPDTINNDIYFTFRHNRCYYSESLNSIMEYKKKFIIDNNIHSVEIDTFIDASCTENTKLEYEFFDKIRDAFKNISAKRILSFGAKVGLTLITILKYILGACFLFGCILTILSICGIELEISPFIEALTITSMIIGILMIIIYVREKL